MEGQKEIKLALKKYRPHELFICRKICSSICFISSLSSIKSKFPLVIEISVSIFQKVAYRKKSGGIIATFHLHDLSIRDLQLPKNPILLILVGIEKPGNIGAMFRSAKAIGSDVILLSDNKTDTFHPNVARSSIGTLFIHNVVIYQSNKLIKWLKKNQIKILATSIREKTINLFYSKLQSGIAIIVGNESLGLDNRWINSSDNLLKIPMNGGLDSLNVSNAVAVILFEMLRQRIESRLELRK